jgi:hypothetical protein
VGFDTAVLIASPRHVRGETVVSGAARCHRRLRSLAGRQNDSTLRRENAWKSR